MRSCATSRDLGWQHEDAAVNNRDVIDHDTGRQWNLDEFIKQCKAESRDLLLAWINQIIQGHHIYNMNESQELMLWGLFVKTKQAPHVAFKIPWSLWIWVGKSRPWNIFNINGSYSKRFCKILKRSRVIKNWVLEFEGIGYRKFLKSHWIWSSRRCGNPENSCRSHRYQTDFCSPTFFFYFIFFFTVLIFSITTSAGWHSVGQCRSP